MKQIYRRTPMPKCDFNKVASGVSEAKLKVEESASDKLFFVAHRELQTDVIVQKYFSVLVFFSVFCGV